MKYPHCLIKHFFRYFLYCNWKINITFTTRTSLFNNDQKKISLFNSVLKQNWINPVLKNIPLFFLFFTITLFFFPKLSYDCMHLNWFSISEKRAKKMIRCWSLLYFFGDGAYQFYVAKYLLMTLWKKEKCFIKISFVGKSKETPQWPASYYFAASSIFSWQENFINMRSADFLWNMN